MIKREDAINFLNKNVANKNIIKHMLATEALMGAVYDHLSTSGKDLGGTKEEWMMAGLLHDGDYNPDVPVKKQGISVTETLKKQGFEIPENVAYCMASHNCHNTNLNPKTLIDWTLFIGDSLTGLIVATALIYPDKKISNVTVDSVLKKFKNLKFASGTRRDDINLCQEKLGISLPQFIEITLKAMQNIAPELGL